MPSSPAIEFGIWILSFYDCLFLLLSFTIDISLKLKIYIDLIYTLLSIHTMEKGKACSVRKDFGSTRLSIVTIKWKQPKKFRVPYLHIMMAMTTTTKNNQSEWLAFEWKIVFTSKGLFHFYRSKRYILLNHESNVINLRHCIGMLRSSRVLCFSHELGQSV